MGKPPKQTKPGSSSFLRRGLLICSPPCLPPTPILFTLSPLPFTPFCSSGFFTPLFLSFPPSPPVSVSVSVSVSPPMEELKKFPASEVSLHSSKEDCWLVIDGKVYDVTQFLEDHPGGEEVLIHASASGDATQSFEDVGHSSTAKSMMTSYLIGALEGYDPSQSPGSQDSLKAGGGQGFVKARTAQQTTSFTVIDFLLPLLILGVAVVSWYMLTYKSHA